MRVRPNRHRLPDLEEVALQGLTFLGQDSERLAVFFNATGASPGDIRELAGTRGFQAAVLDHLVSNESLLLSFAAEAGYAPEMLAGLHEFVTNHPHDSEA